MANRHSWLSWDQYQSAHLKHMARFEHFILRSTLAPVIAETLVFWEGVLYLPDRLELHVRKRQEVRQRRGRPAAVRTLQYSYHAMRVPADDSDSPALVFRYDNAHSHPEHPDSHHLHLSNADGKERVVHIGEDRWPTLGDVLEEREAWWASRQFE